MSPHELKLIRAINRAQLDGFTDLAAALYRMLLRMRQPS